MRHKKKEPEFATYSDLESMLAEMVAYGIRLATLVDELERDRNSDFSTDTELPKRVRAWNLEYESRLRLERQKEKEALLPRLTASEAKALGIFDDLRPHELNLLKNDSAAGAAAQRKPPTKEK